MRFRFLLGTLALLAFVGAGCARKTPDVSPQTSGAEPKPVPAAPLVLTLPPPTSTPRSEAPPLSPEAEKVTTSTHAIDIKGFDYSVKELHVKVGDTVVWTQRDRAPHTVTADDGSFDSPLLSAGQTFSKTFTESGTFSYYCRPHPWMKANIVVE